MTPPLRSNTLDAMDAAMAAQARVRDALESELAYVYGQLDLMRAEVGRLKDERQTLVDAFKEIGREGR
jgi:hypothetical protein